MVLLIGVFGIVFGFFREFWSIFRDPKYRSLLFWVIVIVLSGSLFYRHVEGWSFVDSLYFSVVTLATVGFGDLTPTTEPSKVFTIVYILFGLSILTTFVNMLAKERQSIRDRRQEGQGKKTGVDR